MQWFTRVLAYHPYVVLAAVAVFCSTCIILSLSTVKLPDFRDPQSGFETRGTEIGQRITAWENLLDTISPSGQLTIKPTIPELNSKGKKKWKESIKGSNFSTLNHFNHHWPSNLSSVSFQTHYIDSFLGQVSQLENTLIETSDKEEEWESIIGELDPNSHKHDHVGPDSFFCSEPSNDYGRLVITPIEPTGDIFQYKSIMDICYLEMGLVSNAEFFKICDTITKNSCCRQWSLPNYVALLSNKSSCHLITESDVKNTQKLLKRCQPYFSLTVPTFSNKNIPKDCNRYNTVSNMINFILDFEYTDQKPLKNVLTFLPIAKSSAILKYYHSIQSKLEYSSVKVSGIDFGLKNALFDEHLIKDLRLVGCGAFFVLTSMWIYNGSILITVMTCIAIFFSLGISYFVYTLIFELKFFPFMNLLATVVAIGVGGDTSLMMSKLWNCAKTNENVLSIVKDVHSHSAICTLVTSTTTAVAFYSSFISNITAIRCFSLFAGTAVVANFCVMSVWIPASLVISERFSSICPTLFTDFFDKCGKCFRTFIIDSVINYRWLWSTSLGIIAFLAIPIVFYYPQLRLPDSPELQLFSSSHLFEQYDLYYKNRFWFYRREVFDDMRNSRLRLPLRFIWGVLPIDNGDYMNPASRGKSVMDTTFDLAHPNAQIWLLSFCSKLRAQPFYHQTMGPLLPNCFLEIFVKWMTRKCVDAEDRLTREPCCESAKFPYTRKVFSICIAQAWMALYNTPLELSMRGVAGPKFATKTKTGIPKVRALVVEYDANFTHSTSYIEMDNFYQQVENWTKKELSKAPSGLKNGWFISYLDLYDIQKSLARDTLVAVFISLGASFIIVSLSTLNLCLSILAVVTISFVIVVTIAILVLLKWKLNILEAIAVSLAIGLAVDFTMHYTVLYRLAGGKKENSVTHSLSIMSGPTLMAALTTLIAGAFMLPSSILAYTQIGVFLIVIMCVSWLYSTFFLMSLLSFFGPDMTKKKEQRDYGEQHELVDLNKKTKKKAENSPSAASATSVVHEEEISFI